MFVGRISDDRAPHAARVSASQAILDRAYGKPPTFSTQDTMQLKRAIDMTDDELAAIASGAHLKVVNVTQRGSECDTASDMALISQ